MLQHCMTLDRGRGRRDVPHDRADQGLHTEAGHHSSTATRHSVEVVEGWHLAISGSEIGLDESLSNAVL